MNSAMSRLLLLLVLAAAAWGADAQTATPAAVVSVTDAATPAPGIAALPPGTAGIPVLYRGRVKPLAVAAEEAIEAITGSSHFGVVETLPDERLKADAESLRKGAVAPPAALVLSLWLRPDAWHARPFLAVPWIPLRKQIGAPGQWISIDDGERDQPLLQLAQMKKSRSSGSGERVKLDPLETAQVALAARLDDAELLASGRAVGLTPFAPTAPERAWALATLGPLLIDADDDGRPWRTAVRNALRQTDPQARDKALADAAPWLTVEDLLRPDPALATAVIAVPGQPGNPRLKSVIDAGTTWLGALRQSSGDAAAEPVSLPAQTTAELTAALRTAGADAPDYPSPERLGVELTYQRIAPFTWCWLSYLAGGLLLALGLGLREHGHARARAVIALGTTLTVIGLLFNLYGLTARVIITHLGAVTNLYETLVYVALVSAGLGLGLARGTKNGIYAVAGGLAGALCASVGEAIPPEFGRHPGQLEAVLRTNFWLFTHVKTVVGSYAAFLLALVMGNLVLIRAAVRGHPVEADEGRMIYRCLQVGVVLITAGTLLGAWWADYAWGRFWGWDPKEVFALVTLLTYLIPLHLRYVGLVSPTGLAAWAIFGFMSVVASWYGVNFLLGSGLHAYAFGNGGQGTVLGCCALQLAVGVALLIYVRNLPKTVPA
jgi:ABC-type transport system involved in cytochrome c biogenesis permease subunit